MSMGYSGIILAGGKSSRMGQEKGLLLYKNKPFVAHLIELLRFYCDEIIISSNSSNYEQFNTKIIPDEYKNCGPLGGLHSALKESKSQKNIVVPCDMPLISLQLLKLLTRDTRAFDLLYMKNKDETFPLNAIYKKSCLPFIENQLNKKRYRVQDILPLVNSKSIELDLDLSSKLFNVNTKEDFNQLS